MTTEGVLMKRVPTDQAKSMLNPNDECEGCNEALAKALDKKRKVVWIVRYVGRAWDLHVYYCRHDAVVAKSHKEKALVILQGGEKIAVSNSQSPPRSI